MSRSFDDREINEDNRALSPYNNNPLKGASVYLDALSPWDSPLKKEEFFLKGIHHGYAVSIARRISTFKNNAQGFRMAGSDANYRTVNFLKEEMQRIGINEIAMDKFPVYGWSFTEASLSVNEITFTAVPYVSTPSTPPGGISAPLVYLSSGNRDDYAGLDVEGKIVLIGLDYNILPWPSVAALQAESFGAAAVIVFNVNTYGQGNSGSAYTQQDWSNNAPGIPVVNVSPNCGRTLAKACVSRTLEATLTSHTHHNPQAEAYNLMGKIEGCRYPNENIIIGAHYDGYFQGFQDDALGVGVGMAIMKAILESKYRPQRSIILALVDAEEFGVRGAWADWLTGSWQLANNRKDLHGRTVAVINLELMAYRGSEAIGVRGCDELASFLSSFGESYKADSKAFPDPDIQIYRGVTPWTDEWSYSYFGIPTVGTVADPDMFEKYYHTQFDTEELVCPLKADEMVRFYGSLLVRLDDCLYHPYDLAVRAENYASLLDVKGLKKLGVEAEEAVEQASEFAREAAARLDTLRAGEKYYRDLITTGGMGSKVSTLRRKSRMINTENRALAKEIIANTQYLGGLYPETIVFRSCHYQHDLFVLSRLETLISDNRIREASQLLTDPEKGIQGMAYMPMLTRETFRRHFIISFFNQADSLKSAWIKDRGLFYHDLWDEAAELLSGIPQGGTWDSLLKQLAFYKEKTVARLQTSLASDAALWRRARGQLKNSTRIPLP